jgi:hypothetical protein
MVDEENSANASTGKNGFVDFRGCQVKDPSMGKWRTVEGSDLRLTLDVRGRSSGHSTANARPILSFPSQPFPNC